LEKADILEMTVGYLQNIRKSQALKDGSTFLNFKNGFKQCANVVTGFVEKAEGVDNKVKSRLINYISDCTQSLTPASLAHSSSHVSSTTPSPTSVSSNNIQSMLIGNLLNGIKKSSCTVLPQPMVDANNNTLPNVPIRPPATTPKSCQYPFKFYKSLNNQKVLPPSPSYEVPSSPTSKLLSDAYLLSLYFQPNNGCMWRPW
jgi:hairy